LQGLEKCLALLPAFAANGKMVLDRKQALWNRPASEEILCKLGKIV
jgi:hypothetical protein